MEQTYNKKIIILEQQNKKKDDDKFLNILSLKKINIINAHNDWINFVSIFPLGNIISVSYDKSIKIYDINFNILQNIQNAHNDVIFNVDIRDENNFVTCSKDKCIKSWIKYENKFKMNLIIYNANNDYIYKVIYYTNEKLISCSLDYTIKIWEEKNNKYQLITSLMIYGNVYSILLIKDKNLLISSGDKTNLWNLNNFELIKCFEDIRCQGWNTLDRLDEDRIIIGGYQIFKIISLLKKKIIKIIKLSFECNGIKTIKEKNVFLVGKVYNIVIFRYDNYECIDIIKDAHLSHITGFIEFKNDLIGSYSSDGKIIIWSF